MLSKRMTQRNAYYRQSFSMRCGYICARRPPRAASRISRLSSCRRHFPRVTEFLQKLKVCRMRIIDAYERAPLFYRVESTRVLEESEFVTSPARRELFRRERASDRDGSLSVDQRTHRDNAYREFFCLAHDPLCREPRISFSCWTICFFSRDTHALSDAIRPVLAYAIYVRYHTRFPTLPSFFV